MSEASLALSPPVRRRPAPAMLARAVFAGVLLVSLVFELALVERKYAIFGGGFGQSRTLDSGLEIGAFAAALLLCQTLLFYLLYRLLRRLHGRRADTPLFYFHFVFFTLLGWVGVLIGKFQALSYFSDAMSFQIVRNLGGGSLIDALLYTLSETGLVLLILGGAAIAYGAMRWLIRRRWAEAPPAGDAVRIPVRLLVALLLLVPAALYAANRVDDARSALARFNAVLVWTVPLHQLTDFDRDGWSFYSYPLDLQPFDPARHPYALDIPGNGIDEDGYGDDLVYTEPAPEPAAVIAGDKPHVILIVIESARDDAVGRTYRGRPVTPVIDRIAAAGSRARAAYSHVGFTTFSIKSLFTGRLDPAPGAPSLVGDFRSNGYAVGIFSGQSESFGGIDEATGMRTADIFVDANTLREERAFGFAAEGSLYIDGRLLLREFDRHLGDPAAWETPQFLYFNIQSAHFPYFAPGMDHILEDNPIPRGEIGAENRAWLERTYLNAIAYSDRLVGELLDRLEALGVREDSLIVITADHGESLFDDGFLGHGHALNAEQTRIPFILSAPDVAMGGPVGLADMRPIILRAAGAEMPLRPRERVFQYLGTLDRPGMIGSVDAAGRWDRFDLFAETVAHRGGPPEPYRALAETDRRRAAADRLIDRWASERWRARHRSAAAD